MTDMTPELDKMAAARENSQTIGEFLEWAECNGYHFTKTRMYTETGTALHNGETYEYEVPVEVPAGIEEALADYFEIDLDKARAEREAAYARLREGQS